MPEKAKIYTKGGDLGETSLLGGTRVYKSDDRVEAYGTIDELNAFIGVLRDQPIAEAYRKVLLSVQDKLFIAEALVANEPEHPAAGLPQLQEEDIHALEAQIDVMTSELPPLDSFILPGGFPPVSHCHVARTVCRRAERAVIRLHRKEKIESIIIRYLNRLSDYLFVLARKIGYDANAEEIKWPVKK
jgi:cob(I)alamin adenosyltransferase